ncbi:MAG: hypothetical protein SFW08_05840 [Gemmatimonadaceae bacterium]|nr:hypothetical protein [Gemmatimonadaceae bacterium]
MAQRSADAHAPYRDTFLVPALATTAARVAADIASALPLPDDALSAELDAVYGAGIGPLFVEARDWLPALRAAPDGCACCEPEYTAIYDQFEKAADIASRLVGDALLQRQLDAAPVSAPQWAEAVRKWLGRDSATPLPLVALIASAGMDLAVPPERRRAPAAEKLQQAFDRMCKSRGLTTWPAVIAAIDEHWSTGPVAWTLLLSAEDMVNALDAALREADTREQTLVREAATAAQQAAETRDARAAALVEESLRNAEARIRELEGQLAAARRELADVRAKASRAQTAIDRLLAPEPTAEDAPTAVPAPAPVPEAPAEPEPEDPFPLRGERILLFTNQEREGVRAEQAAALEALGATVTIYFNKSLRTRAPDAFPEGVLVVSDVAFAPHAKTDEIKKRAKKSGVRFLEGKFGAGSIGRAVAEFVKLQRARDAERES